jgi:hypothetical protein
LLGAFAVTLVSAVEVDEITFGPKSPVWQLGEGLTVEEEMSLRVEAGVTAKLGTGMALEDIAAAAHGIRLLDSEGLAAFKERFSKLANSLKEPSLKQSALIMEQMSMTEIENAKAGDAGGMKLVYRKIKELEMKTISEGKQDVKEITKLRKETNEAVGQTADIITKASSVMSKNDNAIKKNAIQIERNRGDWELSVEAVDKTHVQYMDILKERQEESATVAQRVDERSKALDVLTMATFIVCERFKRFSTTAQCIRIKSQPDVEEPPPSERPEDTDKAIRAAKRKTNMYAQSQEDTWGAMHTVDESKVGKPNPEGLPLEEEEEDPMAGQSKLHPHEKHQVDPNTGAPITHGETPEVPAEAAAKAAPAELAESNDDSALVDEALQEDEKVPLKELKRLAKKDLETRVSIPITQLVIALQAGETKKGINLVQVLIDIKESIFKEQTTDKKQFMVALDEYYTMTWDIQKTLSKEKALQDRLTQDSEERRVQIENMIKDTEDQRKAMKTQIDIKENGATTLSTEEQAFGEREMYREEDLENLVKLRSLLRSLYDKSSPTACPFKLNEVTVCNEGADCVARMQRVMCTHADNGWCVFSNMKGDDQRCSCNVGYYGEACEFKMCPGLGKVLYKSNAEMACSGRGICNKLNGECKECMEGFYQGPKKACEFKHCPASGETMDIQDELCSGHGTCNKATGRCKCQYEYSGENCFRAKCGASNGVLYSMQSGNVCDGRGACDMRTGKCSCKAPYSGPVCENKACPANCMDRGKCNENTGVCFCVAPFYGPRCEFRECGQDCGGENAGWCDSLSGKCLCKMGYGGEACKKVQHCAGAESTPVVNWYQAWDKPGWVTCPANQAVSGLYREACNALSCLDSARCMGLCEGQSDQAGEGRRLLQDAEGDMPVEDPEEEKDLENGGDPKAPPFLALKERHCYHALEWYNSFDMAGWSACETNYYITGFYRSCDSLYCLQMAKCCSFAGSGQNARWAQCEEVDWGVKFNEVGWSEVSENKWLTGLFRSKEHELRNIEKASACSFARGY